MKITPEERLRRLDAWNFSLASMAYEGLTAADPRLADMGRRFINGEISEAELDAEWDELLDDILDGGVTA